MGKHDLERESRIISEKALFVTLGLNKQSKNNFQEANR